MCSNCTESFKACSNFKSICYGVEEFIVQYINCKDNDAILDLKDIYSCKEAFDVPEGHDICRLCMDSLRISSFISIDSEKRDYLLEKMVEKCLPELDLLVTEKPVICAPCCESLQHYFGFVTNYLIVEEKMKKYCEVAGVDGTGLIQLEDVLEFTTKNIIDKVDRIKMEEKLCGDEENANEQKYSDELPCASVNTFANKDVEEVGGIKIEETFLEKLDWKIELKPENLEEIVEWQQFNNVPKFIIKSEEVDDQINVMEMKHSYCQETYNELQLEEKNLSSKQHILPQTETNINLTKVQIRSGAVLQVLLDPPDKKCLGRHKNPSDITTYQCEHCSFKTKYKFYLKTHLLTHKNPSECTMNQCQFCSYQTKFKSDLKKHLIIHKNPSEITMYRCKLCLFQTKYKVSLKTHLLIHKNPSECIMNQCEFCPYKTKFKNDFKKHLIIHKNPSEITMFQCEHCLFQTKYKGYLKEHLLNHKNPSEIHMHQCERCSFQTKHKGSLKNHMLSHKNPSEVTMHQCEHCSFQTKHKGSLNKHLPSHNKNLLEITMYQCEHCSFQTKRKGNLKNHLLSHMNPSKITMYQCEHCSFQTRHEKSVKRHLLNHKNPSEITMYQCEHCSFQTKRKGGLKKHSLLHNISSDKTMIQ